MLGGPTLTGLRNRRHFMQWAQRELDLVHRHDLEFIALLPNTPQAAGAR